MLIQHKFYAMKLFNLFLGNLNAGIIIHPP